MMKLRAVFTSNEVSITEDWAVLKIVGSKEQFDGVDVGDEIEYVPSWSEYKLTDLDKQMYEKGFRYKKYIVMRNNQSLDLVNELVPVYIDTQTPISEGKMRDDAGDLRFYWWDETNKVWTEVSYWIDNDTVNTTSTKVILRIPKVSANGYVNVVMYYGAKHFGRKDDLTIAFGNRTGGGKVLSFDGIDDNVDVGRSLEITDRVTLVWFGKIVDVGADTELWKNLAGQYSNTYGGFMLFWNSDIDKLCVYVKDSQGRVYNPVLDVSPPKNAVMYAFSYDRISGDLKGYKNGEKILSRRYTDLVDLGDLSKIKFGIQNNWGKWKGEVYAVMVYNRVLSDEEIQAIYDNPNDPPRAGLILWYAPDSVDDVNGVWRDKSGLGNDGTIVGATASDVKVFEDVVQTSKVMSFDGIDDYVIVDDADDMLAPDTLTVVVWVKDYRYDPNNLGLIAKGNPNGTDPPYSWFFGYYTAHSDALGLVVRSNGSTYLAGFRVSSFDGMLAGVADGSQLKVYANGALMATGSYPGTIDKYNFPLLIGMIYNKYWVNVDVHRVMIYNRALSDTEIQNLYNDPNNPPLDGLKLWLDGTSIDEINGKWLNKAPILKSGYVEPLDGTINGATPIWLLRGNQSGEVDMNNGVKIYWRGTVAKKVESGDTVVLYVKTDNLLSLMG